MTQRPGVGRNVLTTYGARFSVILAQFFLLPIVASATGAAAYGIYLLTVTFSVLFQTDLGMGSATTRFVAVAWAKKDSEGLRRVSAASVTFFLGLAVVASVVMAVVLMFALPSLTLSPDLAETAVVLAVLGTGSTFVASSLSSHRQILSGVGRLDLVNMVQIGQVVVRVAGTFAVLWSGLGIIAVSFVDVSAILLGGVVTWLLRRRLARETNSRIRDFRWASFRQMFTLSIDMLIMSIAALLILQSGNIIVSMILPIAAVAVFGAGFRIYQVSRELTNSLTAALLPAATERHVLEGAKANQGLYLKGTKAANALVIALVVPAAFFAYPLMTLWAGPELAAGYTVAQVLLLSMLFNNNHMVAVPILGAQGSLRAYAILHIIWAVTGIGLGVVLAHFLGIFGVALGMSIPIVILEPLYVGIALSRLGLTWKQFFADVFAPTYGLAAVPAIAMIACSIFLPAPEPARVAISIAVWAVLYGASLWVKGFGTSEKRQLVGHFYRAN